MNYQEIFLNQFNDKVKRAIIEFAKQITNSDCEVYISMARKATCLLDVLIKLGMVSIDGYLTSERSIDMDVNWLKGKKIAIVDDAIISGTTIFQTIKKLETFGAKSIDVHVLCINDNSFEPKLFEEKGGGNGHINYIKTPYLKLNDEECIKACFGIVTALSMMPRPYDVDFPYFNNIKIPNEEVKEIFRNPLWDSDEISSIIQIKHDVYSITLTPDESTKCSFSEFLGFDYSIIGSIKIRLYGRHLGHKAKNFDKISVLPIFIVKPITEFNIQILFDKIVENINFRDEEISNFTSYSSKLRFVQYYLSLAVYRFWAESLPHQVRNKIKQAILDQESISYIFSPKIASKLHLGISIKNRCLAGLDIRANNIVLPLSEESKKEKIAGCNLIHLNNNLYEMFTGLYRDKELRARELVKLHGRNVFGIAEYKDTIDRLKTGFSILDLRNAVSGYDNIDEKKLTSLFLDRAIDSGVVVPILAQKNGCYFRAFRHGEDVIFGEREEKFCVIMLKEALLNCGRKSLPNLWIEKLLVLLFKIGLKKNFIYPVISNIPQASSIVSIRSYLFGPVPIQRKINHGDSIDAGLDIVENKHIWLSNILKDKGLLEEINGAEDEYELKEINYPIKFDRDSELEAEEIGETFGKLLGDEFDFHGDQLTMLAACSDPYDIVSALGAELNIFVKRWDVHKHKFKRTIGKHGSYLELAQSIRLKKNYYFTAIDSGQKKFLWFVNKEPQKLIERIHNQIQGKQGKRSWLKFWTDSVAWDSATINSNLSELIYFSGSVLIELNILTRILELALHKIYSIGNQRHPLSANIFDDLYSSINVFHNRLNDFKHLDHTKHVISLSKGFLDNAKDDRYFNDALIVSIVDMLDNIQGISELKLEDIELVVNNYGKIELIQRYSHLIHIDTMEDEYGLNIEVWSKINRIIKDFNVRAVDRYGPDRAEESLIISCDKNYLGRGKWVASTGTMKSVYLINLAIELYDQIAQAGHIIRITMFTQNPENSRIKVSGKNNTNIKFGYLWHKIDELSKAGYFNRPETSEIITIQENKNNIYDEFNKIHKSKSDRFILHNRKTIKTDVFPTEYSVKAYRGVFSMAEPIDIGIVTIVATETRAVLNSFESYIKVLGKNIKRTFYIGKLKVGKNILNVALIDQIEKGNRSSVMAFNHLREEYSPKLSVLLGIAGSISKDLKLTDVVIANKIIYYETRKETSGKVEREGDSYKIPTLMLNFIKDLFTEHGEFLSFDTDKIIEGKFSVKVGPIGSGEAVIADKSSDLKNWLVNFDRKSMAIEMEAGGFAQAATEEDLRASNGLGYLVVRGISDHADFLKDDKWRKPASEHAVQTLIELLRMMPIELFRN